MGLASKLATIQAAGGAMQSMQGGYGKPPLPAPGQQYGQAQSYGHPQPYGQPQGQQYQQQQQHIPYAGSPSPAQPYGQPPGQYGARPGQSPYGAPQPASSYGTQPGSSYGSQGSAPSPYGAPPQGQGYPGQQPQQNYGQPGSSPYGAPPPGQYGAPQGMYGAPAVQIGSGEQQIIAELLNHCVRDQKLQGFYPPGSVEQIAARVVQTGALNRLASEWRLPKEVAMDCVKLALFDVILYLDDSGSMRFEESGSRIDDLKLILGRVAFATSLFDHDGISVRFMNSQERGDNITNEQQAAQLLQRIQFSGLTPLGTSMDQKILQPMVLQPASQRQLRKPILIITVTDGAPAGEQRLHIASVISNAVNQLRNSPYGPDALSFQFAQVGNDIGARDFLQELDANPQIGSLIDCTSNYELEADQARQQNGIDLSPELWLVKLLLGPIDSSYDSKDERRH